MKIHWLIALIVLALCLFLAFVACGDDDDDDDDDDDNDDNDSAGDDDDDDSEGDDDTGDDDTADDDTGDDDNGDDDNDDNDDDSADDDTTAEDYIYDDNDMNGSWNRESGDIMAITMQPSGYPSHLTEVSAYFFQPGSFRFIIFADENGDGPQDSELVYFSAPIDTVTTPDWYTHDLTTKGLEWRIWAGAWIVGVKWVDDWAPYLAVDTDTESPDCYFYSESEGWQQWPANIEGIFMIRGKGYYGN